MASNFGASATVGGRRDAAERPVRWAAALVQGITYTQYLVRRGFPPVVPALPFLRYMLLESWAAPGFDIFWRRWNPLAGFALYRLYILLGGRRHHHVATFVVFALAGALHDLLLSLVFGVTSIILTAAWCFFAVACLACRPSAKRA